ncbi:EF-hand calcium-binding domain-containing protein 7 isoform X2 [Corythoichthys intestinalis]|uniref:EF-hand calcium-binding domain-containing protein 7 isoform X2 n=1 Tax=Corythoichthys intestinalis TaxID=161448 RepID=UPI0025A6449A|nr:EF-hand calcium-binding domain-containing protein 7 isoform X2 [Corythoichthys intestinalis]
MSYLDSSEATDEEETFYMQCRAAYLSVFKSSLTNISSKQELCRVLQLAGRNPSQATLDKYWKPGTSHMNFDDFCDILKSEWKTENSELMGVFRKLDANGDGYISHSKVEQLLSTGGDKMTSRELKAILSLSEINKDGKFNYVEFCRHLVSTVEKCQMASLVKLQSDAKLKKQNFGSNPDSSPKPSVISSATLLQPPETTSPDPDVTTRKDSRPSSRPSSARSRRSSLSNSITATSSTSKSHHSFMKGCFFLDMDGTINSLQYQLHLPQTSNVTLSIRPMSLDQRADKPSPWMNVDTALFVMSAGDTEEDLTLMCFTDTKDKEKYCWKGELKAGMYYLLPFSSGCRLKKRSQKNVPTKSIDLVYKTDTGELDLTRAFRETLSEIFDIIDLDGNGLLSLEEYNFLELMVSGEECKMGAWASCKENFDMRKNQLTKQGFMELNLMEATEKDGDSDDLWTLVETMGYNRMLELVEACPFQIDIDCESTQPSLQPLKMDSGLKILNQALMKSITLEGAVKQLKGQDNVLIYTYKGEHRVSSLIINKSNQKVTVRVNNKHNINCCSSRGLSVFAIEVPARTKMVCQHVLPTSDKQDWTYNCAETVLSSK